MALDSNFVGDLNATKKLFDVDQWPTSTKLDFLLDQNFTVVFIDPRDKPKPSENRPICFPNWRRLLCLKLRRRYQRHHLDPAV